MAPPGPDATLNTPLAPSVEKAYYRKCIELKRRLNDVEEANDAARLRKIRLNRAIMKMRLERAFLLDQLSKRMENEDEDSNKPQDTQEASPSQQPTAPVRIDAPYFTAQYPGPASQQMTAAYQMFLFQIALQQRAQRLARSNSYYYPPGR